MRIGVRRRLRQDPLEYIEDLHRGTATGVIRLPWGGWCVNDVDLAQELLRGPEFNGGRSGFFGDLLPTRAMQVEIGHAVRNFLRAHVPQYRAALAAAVADLPVTDRWPAAGTTLVYRCLADLLLYPGSRATTRRLMDRAVHGGVVLRSPHMWQRAQAEVLRGRLITAVAEQVGHRREHRAHEQRDVLDAVLDACPDELTDRAAAELYLVMFRSIVAPVSATLAWSVLLAGLHHTSGSAWPWPVDQVVREALRHRPMAWMLGRILTCPTEFAGLSFQPGDILSVSPYLLHHDEHRWTDPEVFRPGRWARPDGRGPYIPYGAGPFTCVGASLAHQLITEALTALTRDARLTVTGGDARPLLTDNATPRPFTVQRTCAAKEQADHSTGGR
jgi:cytochrome P450